MRKLVYLISIIHLLTVVFMLYCCIYLLINDIYIGFPISILVLRILYSRDICPLTKLEDYFRNKAKMKSTNGKWIKFYINRIKVYYIQKQLEVELDEDKILELKHKLYYYNNH